MTKQEVVNILGIIKVAYPNSFQNMQKSDIEALINLWYRQFKDYDYKLVQNAIDSIISVDKNPFMPSIGRIKEMINTLTQPQRISEQEAWGLVYDALRNSIYHAQEEFDKLPPTVQRIVGGPSQLREWAMMPSDTLNSVVASNFQRSYRVRAKYEEEFIALPNDIKALLENSAEVLKLKG